MDSMFPVPPRAANLDLAETSLYLGQSVDYILRLGRRDIPAPSLTNLYTTIYKYCNPAGKLEQKRCSELYTLLHSHLTDHLTSMVETCETLQDIDLLQYYTSEWGQYSTSANILSRMFKYLDRYWIKCQRDEGNQAIYPIHTLALSLWKEVFVKAIQTDNEKLTTAVLNQIVRQSTGESIDQGLVKTLVDSFVSLGLADSKSKTNLTVYDEHLGTPFIVATQEFRNLPHS